MTGKWSNPDVDVFDLPGACCLQRIDQAGRLHAQPGSPGRAGRDQDQPVFPGRGNLELSRQVRIEQASEQFRDTTMNVLRVTFLSALVLELVATLSTAVIAVEIGLRLIYYKIEFEQAFFLLVLAPEFYIPLRMLGLRFHAGMNGTTAARKIFAILETPVNQESGIRNQASPQLPNLQPLITFDNLSFTYPDETTPALANRSFTIEKGQKIAQMLIQKIERPEIKEV